MRHPEPSSGQPPDDRERLSTQPPHHVATPHQSIASHLPHLSNLGPGGLLPGGIAAAHISSPGSTPGMRHPGDSPKPLPDTTATTPVLHKPGHAPATAPQQQPGGSSTSGTVSSPLLPAQPAAAPAGLAAAAGAASTAASAAAQDQGGGPSGVGQALSGAAAGTHELLAAAVGLPENSLTGGGRWGQVGAGPCCRSDNCWLQMHAGCGPLCRTLLLLQLLLPRSGVARNLQLGQVQLVCLQPPSVAPTDACDHSQN
jgi:hypothetical protein